MPRKKNPKNATYLVETAMKLRSDSILISVHLGSFLKKGHPLRAEEIESLGITGFDALHIAAAEAAGCDYLVTTDDELLKKSKRHSSQLTVSVLNPIDIVSLP